MSLTNRTEMRRCGQRWATQDEAEHSKKYLSGGYQAVTCLLGCGEWHLEAVKSAPKGSNAQAKPVATVTAETFPPAVADLIDRRDGDDTGAALVRLCQGCGKTRNLQRHHRRGKDAGGSGSRLHAHCACNGLSLCLTCHRWAHAHPEAARAMGWIVSQSEDEPASVGVMRFAAADGGATQWPSCSGEWMQTALEAREAA